MTEKEIIRRAMAARGINQTMLAEMCGLKRQSNVSEMLRGKSMRVESLVMLLETMGFEVIVRDKNKANKDNQWRIERQEEEQGE